MRSCSARIPPRMRRAGRVPRGCPRRLHGRAARRPGGTGASGMTAANALAGGSPSGGGLSGLMNKLGGMNQWMQKKGGALDDLMKPVGQVMNAVDMLGLNKPPGKLPPIQSKLTLQP